MADDPTATHLKKCAVAAVPNSAAGFAKGPRTRRHVRFDIRPTIAATTRLTTKMHADLEADDESGILTGHASWFHA
jgi:hypothetical protein